MLGSKKVLISFLAALAFASLSTAQDNPDDPPLGSCTGCAAGKCENLDPKSLYVTFPEPVKTKIALYYVIKDPNKHLSVQIAKDLDTGGRGISEGTSDSDKISVKIKDPHEQGCIVVGFKSSQMKNEAFAVLEQAYPSQWSCAKKFHVKWDEDTQVRAWKVADGLCPHGLKDDST